VLVTPMPGKKVPECCSSLYREKELLEWHCGAFCHKNPCVCVCLCIHMFVIINNQFYYSSTFHFKKIPGKERHFH
jgi:hypothetical protein